MNQVLLRLSSPSFFLSLFLSFFYYYYYYYIFIFLVHHRVRVHMRSKLCPRRVLVLGGGTLGTACSFALLATRYDPSHRHRHPLRTTSEICTPLRVTLLSREKSLEEDLVVDAALRGTSREHLNDDGRRRVHQVASGEEKNNKNLATNTLQYIKLRPSHLVLPFPSPPLLAVRDYQEVLSGLQTRNEAAPHICCVCTPVHALQPSNQHNGGSCDPIALEVLKECWSAWRRPAREGGSLCSSDSPDGGSGAVPRCTQDQLDNAALSESRKETVSTTTTTSTTMTTTTSTVTSAVSNDHAGKSHHYCHPPPHTPSPSASALPPFILVFSRGFTAAGDTATGLIRRQQCQCDVEEAKEKRGTDEPVLLTVCGPIIPREWAQQNAMIVGHERRKGAASAPVETLYSSPFSGTSFTVAVASSSSSSASASSQRLHPAADDHHVSAKVHSLLCTLFPRENVQVYELARPKNGVSPSESSRALSLNVLPPAAQVLGVVNGCLPLVAFGAGLVQAAYATCGATSALLSYAQNIVTATASLIVSLVGHVCVDAGGDFSLPSGAVSALMQASLDHSAREFILGRRMDTQFRQEDALRAVFPSSSTFPQPQRGSERHGLRHHSPPSSAQTGDARFACTRYGAGGGAASTIAHTVDGLHILLARSGASNPMYEILLDAYQTILRASQVGNGLVHADYPSVFAAHDTADFPLLKRLCEVDAASFSGDAEKLRDAARQLVETFPPPPGHSVGPCENKV